MARLFRKDIEPDCSYCSRSTTLNEEELVCLKRGIVSPGNHCSAFRYDPLRRVPPRPVMLNTKAHNPKDFEL